MNLITSRHVSWLYLLLAAMASPGGAAAQPVFTDANWISFGTSFSLQNPSFVRALAVDQQATVYAGTAGTNGVYAAWLAGGLWSRLPTNPFQSGLGRGIATALAVDRTGDLYVGGFFMGIDTSEPFVGDRAGGAGWVDIGGLTRCGLFGEVQAIAVDSSNNVYVAGSFCQAYDPAANQTSVGSIARWDGQTWSGLGTGPDGRIYALAIDPTTPNLYAGGAFTAINGISATNVAKWDGTVWSPLASGLGNPAVDSFSQVNALGVDLSGNLYAGGYFTNAGSVPSSNIAKWDGQSWSALGPGTDGPIFALAVDFGGNVYAGGAFTNAGDVQANNIAGSDGQNWWAIGSGVTGFDPSVDSGPAVNALAFDPAGNLYVGGSFTYAGNQVSTWLAQALVSPRSYGLALTLQGGETNLITGWGTPGIPYVLEATPNLGPPVQWTPLATNRPTTQQLLFTNSTIGPQRFYRVRSGP